MGKDKMITGEMIHTLCFLVNANKLFPDSNGYGGCSGVGSWSGVGVVDSTSSPSLSLLGSPTAELLSDGSARECI